jgi:hypothetical protein
LVNASELGPALNVSDASRSLTFRVGLIRFFHKLLNRTEFIPFIAAYFVNRFANRPLSNNGNLFSSQDNAI